MAGLSKPTTGTLTQAFGLPASNVASLEPSGYLQSDTGGARRYRKTKFKGGVYHDHIHPGNDIANSVGTPILAMTRCKILQAGTYPETGEHYLIVGVHKNSFGRWDTVIFYTHLKADSVKYPVGRTVARGTTIALMGRSGRVTGPHLHVEVRHSFSADPGSVKLSTSWFKFNPRRLQIGGDMASITWIKSNF